MPPPNKMSQAEADCGRDEMPSHESLEWVRADQMRPGDVIEITTENGSKYNVLVEAVNGETPYVRLLTKTRFEVQRGIMGSLTKGRSVQFLEDSGERPKRFLTSRVTDIRCKYRLLTHSDNADNTP
jgi:hypothetical protein